MTEALEQRRPHLRRVAYRMLGSFTEADEAVQETWLRVSRAGAEGIENVDGWLTTIVSRICLNMLRAREGRRETSLHAVLDLAMTGEGTPHPEDEALLADAVGIALLVVLDSLTPAERVAFVLHDMFDVPFAEIGELLERSPAATRQLASRARRRIRRAATPNSDDDIGRQRTAVEAFFRAARSGDLHGLLALLDPDVAMRLHAGSHSLQAEAASAVADIALVLADPNSQVHPVTVGVAAGALITVDARPVAIVGFTVAGGRIVGIDAIAEPDRVTRTGSRVSSRPSR